MKKSRLTYIAIFAVVLVGAVGFSVSCATEPAAANGTIPTKQQADIPSLQLSSPDDQISRSMNRLEALYRTIDDAFLFETDHEQIYSSMAKALFKALDDPYSAYITEDESRELTDQAEGVYGGIGAYISKPNPDTIDEEDPESYMVTIVSPFSGSPAYHSGLHAGDLISHIDGDNVRELTAEEASNRLRGEPGTRVKLTVHRGSSTFTVSVTREIIEIPTIEYDRIGDIGYIHILQFTSLTGEKVEEAIRELAEDGGFSSLILDLRSNPGGVVESSQQIADMFLNGKTIFTIETNNETETAVISARRQTLVPEKLPVVLLIDGGSASASEILAGALKDHDRAVVIGSTSFGKGLVQQVYPFGNDYFKLTTARYLTPGDHNIHELGIEPDILVEQEELTDEQLEEYAQLIEENTFTDFVEAHPEQDTETSDQFVQSLRDEGITIPPRYLHRFIRMEYERKMDFPPVYDLEFDLVLNRALEYLRTGE